MSLESPISPEQVDSLVREYLEAEGRTVDVARMEAAIEQRRASPDAEAAAPIVAAVSRRRTIWRLAIAASVVAVVGLCTYAVMSPVPANAYALVSEARSALARPADRCYQIETHVPKAWLRNNPILDSGQETLLWTRGDRFRVTTIREGLPHVWGQDERQRVWVVCDSHRGVRFERNEVPPSFARTRAYLGLDVRRLAKRFLDDFDLAIEPGGVRGVVMVRATARPGLSESPFNVARLRIETKTKTIRKMVLSRIVDGTVKARFTFTLLDDAQVMQGGYALEEQLPPGSEILEADRDAERSEALRMLFEEQRPGKSPGGKGPRTNPRARRLPA